MQFKLDVHWCLILWLWLRHDDLLYLKRLRRSRGFNLFSFSLPHLSRTRGRQASVLVFLNAIFELCPGLGCKLLPTAVFRRSRLAVWLLCRWSAYCRGIVKSSWQQTSIFYVVLDLYILFLFWCAWSMLIHCPIVVMQVEGGALPFSHS